MITFFRRALNDPFRFTPILFLFFFFILPILIWLIITHELLSITVILKPPFIKQFLNTGSISLLTALFSVIFAYPIALFWWILKKSGYISKILIVILLSPIILGLTTRNYSWMGIFSGTPFQYSMLAVLIVMIYIFIPFSFFVLIQGMNSISNLTMDASKTMGANIIETFTKVIFPQTIRQCGLAFLLVFSNSLCFYITPSMIGGGKYDMVGNVIWQLVNYGQFNEASKISIIFLIYIILLDSLLFIIYKAVKYFYLHYLIGH